MATVVGGSVGKGMTAVVVGAVDVVVPVNVTTIDGCDGAAAQSPAAANATVVTAVTDAAKRWVRAA